MYSFVMKFLYALILFAIPVFSYGAVVPHWYQGSGISFYFDSGVTASTTNPWLYLTPVSGANIGNITGNNPWYWDKSAPCIDSQFFPDDAQVPCFLIPDDVVDGQNFLESDYTVVYSYSTTDPSSYSDPHDWWPTTWFNSPKYSSVSYYTLIQRSADFCNYISSSCPSVVYVGVALKDKNSGSTDYEDFIPISYWRLTLQSGSFGSDPIYTVDTETQENIFPAFTGPGSPAAIAFNLKEAIHVNTIDPDCDFSELFESAFWSECVARSIFNWLLIPSDSAIDTLVGVSSDPDFGTTWSYVVLAPIFTSTLVQACPMENPSTCDIGADYLTVPILDVNGDVTPFEVVPDSFVPAYFDAFLASIMQVLIIVSLSYILIFKFL